ncbi:hypothetical protein G7046_g9325 [Stylonectria norvegica]|nr:hypothetical protein G7046_g9325 [Stylonectria norvegica]
MLSWGRGPRSGREDAVDDAASGPVVDLGYSRYRGSYLRNGLSEFLQMRFAQPPTGDLRWRAPLEPQRTEGIIKAQEFGAFCVGNGQNLGIDPQDGKLRDEDCLFVNVWAPTNVTADSKLPVMVFIQGGGYTVLANANWNASQIVETSGGNMVYVNFNYRVGLWGFLAGEEVRKDGSLNAGLLDQRLLLEWVQKYISRFGGDPDHVVLQGVSAGAGSVALQLIAYGGRNDNLFVGAIAESVFFPAQPHVSALEYQFDRTLDEAGCREAPEKMGCLRAKSKEELQRINHSSRFPGQDGDPLFYWTPCVDGDFLSDYPYRLFTKGDFVRVPVLFGACTNEGSGFASNATSPEDLIAFFQQNYPNLTPAQTDYILQAYPLEAPLNQHAAWFPSTSRAYGEATFICPTNNLLHAFATSPNTPSPPPSTWSYRYNVQDFSNDERGHGVPHVFESAAVMGPDMLPPDAVPPSYLTYNAKMVPLMMNYWISFARALDPNVYRLAGAPQWDTWGVEQRRMLFELRESVMETVDGAERERCTFWQDNVDVMEQ